MRTIKQNTILRETLDTLAAAGIRPDVVCKRHIKVRWQDAAGRKRTLVMPNSPSDRRTRLNNRALLRRLLEQT